MKEMGEQGREKSKIFFGGLKGDKTSGPRRGKRGREKIQEEREGMPSLPENFHGGPAQGPY